MPIVGRLDQRKGEIAQRAFVVGEIVGGDRRADAGRGLLADPGMDIVGDQRVAQSAEIADAGAAGKNEKQRERPRQGSPSDRIGNGLRGDIDASPFSGVSPVGGRRCPPADAYGVRPPRRCGSAYRSIRMTGRMMIVADSSGRITTETHDAPLVREFNNVAHQPLSSAAGTEAFCPDARNSASP